MKKTKKSNRTIERAKISWEQSQIDLQISKSCIKSVPEKSSLQSTQSAVNALSSVLEGAGHFQLPAFSTIELLDYCIKIDTNFEKIRSSCYILDGSLERDIFGQTRQKNTHFTPSFARACYHASMTVQKAVKTYWQKNRDHFFNP